MGEYWIVDPEREAVEVRALQDGATEPVRYAADDELRWTSSGTSDALVIALPELFCRPSAPGT